MGRIIIKVRITVQSLFIEQFIYLFFTFFFIKNNKNRYKLKDQ